MKCVYLHSVKSEAFMSLRGVKQGEHLSLLSALFVNDPVFAEKWMSPVNIGDATLYVHETYIVLVCCHNVCN